MHSTSLTEITPVSTRRSNYSERSAVIGGGGGRFWGRVVIGLHFESAVIRSPSLEQLNFAVLPISPWRFSRTRDPPHPLRGHLTFMTQQLGRRIASCRWIQRGRISKPIFRAIVCRVTEEYWGYEALIQRSFAFVRNLVHLVAWITEYERFF